MIRQIIHKISTWKIYRFINDWAMQYRLIPESEYANPLNGCKKVLDIGCGRGYFFRDGWVGIDKDRKYKSNKIKIADATKLPFKKNSFDGVFCCALMEHLTYQQNIKMFKEVWRVLKPKGKFLLIIPHKERGLWDNPEHLRSYTLQAIKHLIEWNNIFFSIAEHEEVAWNSYRVLLIKKSK